MSTVPEVLTALATIGRATLPNTQVIEGLVTGIPTTLGRLLLVGNEEFTVEREPDSLAGNTATEKYTVPCAIAADISGPEQSVADALAWADYEALETALSSDPSLGLSGSFSLRALVVDVRFQRLSDADGRHALIRFGIDVYAAND